LIHTTHNIQQRAFECEESASAIVGSAVGLLSDLQASAQDNAGRLVAASAEVLLTREIKPREMLLEPFLAQQGLGMLYGYRGDGKTFLGLGIAAAVGSGGRFLRWNAPRSRRVVFVDGELPAKTLQERTAMILAGMQTQPESVALRFITPDFQSRPMPDLATAEGQALLEPHLAECDLLILDNLSALCREGVENEGESWLPVQDWALRLRRGGISVLFIHHAGKNRTQRGTSRREDLLDFVLALRHPAEYHPSEGLRVEVHFEKTRGMLGEAAKPFEAKLDIDPNGRAVWTMQEIEGAKLDQAATLFSAGLSVRDVASELNISRSAAGRFRQQWEKCPSVPVSQRGTLGQRHTRWDRTLGHLVGQCRHPRGRESHTVKEPEKASLPDTRPRKGQISTLVAPEGEIGRKRLMRKAGASA